MRAQAAVLPHSLGEGPSVGRITGTRLSSLALCGAAAVLPILLRLW